VLLGGGRCRTPDRRTAGWSVQWLADGWQCQYCPTNCQTFR